MKTHTSTPQRELPVSGGIATTPKPFGGTSGLRRFIPLFQLTITLMVISVANVVQAAIPAPLWHDADLRTSSGSGTSLSVERPGNLSEGDLVILLFTQQRSPSSTASSFTVPSGFTRIRSEHDASSQDRPEVTAFYKIATSAEPANYTSTVTQEVRTPRWKAVAARVTGHDVLNPIGAHNGANSGGTSVSSIAISSISTASPESLLIAARSVRRAISLESDPAGMSLEWSMTGSGNNDSQDNPPAFRGASQVIPNEGPTGSRHFAWSGNALASGLMFSINRYKPHADLEVTKTVSHPAPLAGESVTFFITATNHGPDAATGVKVFDKLADGFTYQTDNSGGSYDPVNGIWTIGNLAVNASVTLEITAEVNASGDYSNDATIIGNEEDPNPANGVARSGIHKADLSLTMDVSPKNAREGETTVFTLTVENAGPYDALGVRVENQLPSGYIYQGDDGAGSYDPVSGIWMIGTLADQAQTTLNIQATVLATGVHLNMACVESGSYDPNSTNNHAMVTIDNPNVPIVNGLFHGDGDNQRYVLLTTSANGSKLYGYYDTRAGRYYATLVVSRNVNDNVFGNREYTADAGWGTHRSFKRLTDSEYMDFTLTCGNQSWSWRQGYCAQPNGGNDLSSPTWFSSHQAGAGSGTPPPGYVSASSMAWNLNNQASGNANSWDVSLGGSLALDDWKSPFHPSASDKVVGMDGFPSTGDITFCQTYGWEWSMVYEFSVDLSELGPHPVRLMNISSHHSPAKSGGENDPIVISGPLLDWGDLPAPYPTLDAHNGPRHEVVYGGAFLGNLPPDVETDGQSHPAALGDDLNGISDEDGVRFLTPIKAGSAAQIQVTAGTAGYLSAWMDFNGDGTLTQLNAASVSGPAMVAGGLIGDLHLPQPGDYVITIMVPSNATGLMPSRWRFTNLAAQGGNSITGLATTGEVEDYMLSAIGDRVWMDSNGNGLQDEGEAGVDGVTVSLLDENGNPVLDGSGSTITTVTSNGGQYSFAGLPVATYRVGFSNLPDRRVFTHANRDGAGIDGPYNSDADPATGITASFTLTQGEINNNIDAGLHARACPDHWTDWSDKWDGPLGGDTAPDANPDGDRYSNVIEYAFCLRPNSGAGKPFCLAPSATVEGAVDGVYGRTAIGGAKDVTYILEWAPELGNPTVWTGSTVLDDTNTYVTNPGNAKESVRIPDLENLTGLTSGRGFVRIRVILDNGVVNAEDTTEVLGWVATDLDPHCQSYNNPFLACAVFTGTISEVNGSDAVFGTSAGPVDLSSVLDPAYSYFIEVESGDLEGHRFDIIDGFGDKLTLLESTPLSDAISGNAVAGGLPEELAGDRIAVHRHRTVSDLFPPTGFGAGANRSSADKVRVYAGGIWSDYWLYSNSGEPVWLKAGANSFDDHGGTVIPPGQGVFFDSEQTTTSILAYGEVRGNRFVRPLETGHSLVGGGYPMDQSANGASGRNMNAATGFLATNDFKTADTFFFWNGDYNTGTRGYTSYYLLNGSRSNPDLRWVKVGDAMLVGRDTETLLLGDRAVFIRSKAGHGLHTMPTPWEP